MVTELETALAGYIDELLAASARQTKLLDELVTYCADLNQRLTRLEAQLAPLRHLDPHALTPTQRITAFTNTVERAAAAAAAGRANTATVQSQVAVAATGAHQLAALAETHGDGPLHQAAWAVTTAAGVPEAGPVGELGGATIGLGIIPRGTNKHDRELARAFNALRALLRAWARLDSGSQRAELHAQADSSLSAASSLESDRSAGPVSATFGVDAFARHQARGGRRR